MCMTTQSTTSTPSSEVTLSPWIQGNLSIRKTVPTDAQTEQVLRRLVLAFLGSPEGLGSALRAGWGRRRLSAEWQESRVKDEARFPGPSAPLPGQVTHADLCFQGLSCPNHKTPERQSSSKRRLNRVACKNGPTCKSRLLIIVTPTVIEGPFGSMLSVSPVLSGFSEFWIQMAWNHFCS